MTIAARTVNVAHEAVGLLDKIGVDKALYTGGDLASYSPVTGEQLAALKTDSQDAAGAKIDKAARAFQTLSLIHI